MTIGGNDPGDFFKDDGGLSSLLLLICGWLFVLYMIGVI
jgi:hypothetical protein